MIQHQREFNDEIRRIFVDGKVKPIRWGGDSETSEWASWSVDEKLEYAKELASAMNHAAEILQRERDDLATQIQFLRTSLESADDRVTIYKDTLTESITKHNAERQSDAAIIEEMRVRIKAQDATIEALNGDHD